MDLSQTESGRKSFQVSQELFKDLRFVFKSVLSQEEVCNFLRVVRHNLVTQHVFSVSLKSNYVPHYRSPHITKQQLCDCNSV